MDRSRLKSFDPLSPRGRLGRSTDRLVNRGKILLELNEVQTGSYLREDDIERIEDVYKRK